MQSYHLRTFILDLVLDDKDSKYYDHDNQNHKKLAKNHSINHYSKWYL